MRERERERDHTANYNCWKESLKSLTQIRSSFPFDVTIARWLSTFFFGEKQIHQKLVDKGQNQCFWEKTESINLGSVENEANDKATISRKEILQIGKSRHWKLRQRLQTEVPLCPREVNGKFASTTSDEWADTSSSNPNQPQKQSININYITLFIRQLNDY